MGAGFARYQARFGLILMADTGCRIVGRATDTSGRVFAAAQLHRNQGPLLIEKDGKWYIAGIDVAAELGVASGLAVVADEARRHL